ncbi:hypothetical protein RYZ96_24165 [Escherichia coli]|nr:hypothetical protein [Escherichia coli]MDW2353492.1 hypothetical protein [Escherichia coli]
MNKTKGCLIANFATVPENLLQERLQQMERDMVRDLQKEKTLGGD